MHMRGCSTFHWCGQRLDADLHANDLDLKKKHFQQLCYFYCALTFCYDCLMPGATRGSPEEAEGEERDVECREEVQKG